MKTIDLIKLSTRTFKTRLTRTLLTILGVSVGIGAIFFLVSLGYGLQYTLLQSITTSESLLTLDVSSPNGEVLPLNEKALSEMAKISGVKEISPLAVLSGQITLGDLTSNISLYGCRVSYFRLGGYTTSEGNFFENDDEQKGVISTALIKSFGLDNENTLGNNAKIVLFYDGKNSENGEGLETVVKEGDYEISGIIENELDSLMYIPLDTISDMGVSNYAQVKVRVSDNKSISQVRDEIIAKGFLVSALSDTVAEANKVFRIIQIILAIFGLISLLVAAIGLANTMTVTLLERTNEIGIMKAIGSSDSDIKKMFLLESVIMGFLGGAGGIIIGFTGSAIFNFALNILARGLGGQGVVLFQTPVWFILFVIIFSTLVGLATGIFPSKKAAKMNALEALRYK
jgi:ABC-type antimicrobial peptide transport system permease subunit